MPHAAAQDRRAYARQYYAKHRRAALIAGQARRDRNREAVRAAARKWYRDHRIATLAWHSRRQQELKLEIFAKYGGAVCRCCGERNPNFLTLDHVDTIGARQREKAGSNFYQWLKRNGFPRKPKLRVLCFNCNMGRRRTGVCPHIQERRNDTANG